MSGEGRFERMSTFGSHAVVNASMFSQVAKDGVPFPVDRPSYDQTIQHLSHLIENARLDGEQKYAALKRLKSIAPN